MHGKVLREIKYKRSLAGNLLMTEGGVGVNNNVGINNLDAEYIRHPILQTRQLTFVNLRT